MKLQFLRLLLLLGLSLWLVQCEHNVVTPDNRSFRELTSFEKKLVVSGNRFGLQLFREVVQQRPGENLFLSPLSVAMALGMTLNGANGETYEAMQNTLELAGLSQEEINQSYQSLIALLMQLDPRVEFQIANSIWHRQEMAFEPEFLKRNQTYFNARVSGVDFSAPATLNLINTWVSDNTHGRIPKIIDEIKPEHVMFLINAIYFKGKWTYQFDPANTRDDWFITANGAQQPCRMMHQKAGVRYAQHPTLQAVDLPYGDAGFSMTILLPNPGISLDSLISALNAETWAEWMNGFAERELMIAMPKFTMTFDITLNRALQSLGMGVAFTERADFSQMCKSQRLLISEVKHKTFVEVNEEGTEAAAVTSVGIGVVSAPPQFRIDRPFLFAIRDSHSQTILFIGKMEYPQ
ncbi:serpin family protein [candidate division KSB1 bacterium]|nr:serpin family protein [bacterium]NUM67465.1 serpin family protein [candidate division KSB1 bacterium]